MPEMNSTLVELMDALRPMAVMRRHLSKELKDDPEAAVGVLAGVVIYVKDIDFASLMYAKCAAAYKVTPGGSWSDTVRMKAVGGTG
jgi:hypothetical protein